MSLSEQLERLADLHARGRLSDAEFERAKARVLDGVDVSATLDAVNGLRRSRNVRWVAGVCGGLAQATGAEVWVWRLGFALLGTCGGAGVLIYLLMWIFVPAETGVPAPAHA